MDTVSSPRKWQAAMAQVRQQVEALSAEAESDRLRPGAKQRSSRNLLDTDDTIDEDNNSNDMESMNNTRNSRRPGMPRRFGMTRYQ